MKFGKIVLGIMSFIASLVTILGWFSITPEDAGKIVYWALPPIAALLFFLTGCMFHSFIVEVKGPSKREILNALSSLTRNQKMTLRQMYDTGDALEINLRDGEMQQLASLNLVILPQKMNILKPVKVMLQPKIRDIINKHTDILEDMPNA